MALLSVGVEASDTLYAISNGNVTISHRVNGVLDEILWKHGLDKAVEWDSKEKTEFRDFLRRTTLDTVTGALTIRQLTKKQSGMYEAEYKIGGKIQIFRQKVEVIGKLFMYLFF